MHAESLDRAQSIYRDWTFNYLPSTQPDIAVTAAAFDDAHWPAIALPHTWNTFETTRAPHPFIHAASERDDPYWWKGWGVYRKRFILPAALRAEEKLVFVEFDGVQKYARVFLNGHELGENKGGYSAFSFELTPHLRHDGENVLVVLVSNRRDDSFGGIPPMTAGNFNVYGGIYRDVRLVVKDRLHIPFQGSPVHEGGAFVTTPEVSRERGVVEVTTWLKNAYPTSRTARVVTRVIAPDGSVAQTFASDAMLAAGALTPVAQRGEPIPRPQLWSPDRPALYRVETRIEVAGRVVDELTSPLGFRWFRWDKPTNRLVINDEPVVINGTNRHQEYPWLGDAMPKWLHARDLDDIRHNLAHNFMRTAHYPQDDFAYALNDRLGIVTVAEVPNIKWVKFGRDIQEANARAMVRRLRNHPSILFWSVGNETGYAADSRWVWEEDKTRIIHQRHAENFGDFVTHDHTQLDLEAMLRCTVRGWHDDDFENLARVHPSSGQITGTEEWQPARARVAGSSVRGVLNEQSVAWLYADHGCDRIYENAPLKYLNPKGWVDAYREPKYMYYAWQANWSPRPMVFVQPHAWHRKFLGQRKSLQVDSNADEVELFAGGESLGVRKLSAATFRTASFDNVLVVDAPLRAEARRDGRTVATWRVPMAGAPARLELLAIHDALVADRASVAVLRVDVVDADGQHVGGARPALTWEVEGPAQLLTPAVYESDFEKDGASDGVWYTDTPIGTLVRATATPGKIRVRVASPGLAAAEVTLESIEDARAAPAGVVEPPLADAGRQPVARVTGFIDRVPFTSDLGPLRDIQQFGVLSRDGYRAALDRLIRDRNPSLKPMQPAYDRLLDRLVQLVAASSGSLIEDDFNHLAALYSACAHLCRVVDTLSQHPAYLDAWRERLARTMLVEGAPVSVEEMETLLRALPKKGAMARVVFAAGSPHAEYDRIAHIHAVRAPDLPAALAQLHPAFATASSAERTRIEADVLRINPWLATHADTAPLWLPEDAGRTVGSPARQTP